MDESIIVEDLTKRFGPVLALERVSLQVAPGEVVVLLGPNGAGKSTLMRILGTTVLPDDGLVQVAGHWVTVDPAAVRRSVGLVLGDERSWYWRLSGRQNLEFFAAMHGLGRRQASQVAQELLDELGLAAAADTRFDRYSSGMRRRLSLARALIMKPQVLLLDEPTQSLDPVAAAGFRSIVREQADERGAAVLLATHDLHEAAEIGDRILGLASGRVAFTRADRAEARELESALAEVATL